jgi:hypothetical protein
MVWEAVVGNESVRGNPKPAKVVRSTVTIGFFSGAVATHGIAVFVYWRAGKAAI